MKARVVYFQQPRWIEIREEVVPEPGEGEVRVETEVSAISAGTELLLYRGELLPDTILDDTLSSLAGPARYPLAYGYAAVGRVVDAGKRTPENLLGRRVFAFEPHRSAFLTRPEALQGISDSLPSELAALFPTVETAVSLIHDARPLMGEGVLVVGQGVVGLAVTSLLSRFPLGRLVTADRWEPRRRISVELGAERSCAPEELDERDFDLTIEVSGSPEGLNAAVAATGYEGRIVVGSWYGDKRADAALGTHFHRGRIRIQSSQVSRISSHLRGRWSKERRMRAAFEALSRIPASRLVSHRFPIERAGDAYRLLDESPEKCLQVLLTYD
jgi:2-desacetyl-2-hydroxyethyl bacteriochlorophyllide A dehydrogenase